LAEARHVAIWFMREFLKMSYPELGREFVRDHTSCISASRRIDRELPQKPLLCERMAAVADRLRVRLDFVAGEQ
jgi:chromosomal replication initiation ATPase DnaA